MAMMFSINLIAGQFIQKVFDSIEFQLIKILVMHILITVTPIG